MAAKQLSLRPFSGHLWVATTREDYEKADRRIFKTPDVLTCATEGRFSGGQGKDGVWTYLVYAESAPVMAHELSHALFAVFEHCGINPADSGGEVFCYMLQQLLEESGMS